MKNVTSNALPGSRNGNAAKPSASGPHGHLLSATQRALLASAAEFLEDVSSVAHLQHCARTSLQHLLPHDRFSYGFGSLPHGQPAEPILDPAESPDAAALPLLAGEHWPLLQRWLIAREPLLLAANAAQRAPCGNLALHGAVDPGGMFVSWFCFSGMPAPPRPSCATMLRVLAPHLHFAVLRIRTAQRQSDLGQRLKALSSRQFQVLHWARLGKTNAEIGTLLHTSTANVKYHLRETFHKLDVANRAHAVALLTAYDAAANPPYGPSWPSAAHPDGS